MTGSEACWNANSSRADRFPFTVAHHGGDNQIRIIERGPIRACEGVTQLAALVNGPGVSGAT